MKRKLIIVITLALVLGALTSCASWDRFIKSTNSDFSGGLDRTVNVYDNGEVIKTYSGKIDIQDTEYGNKVLFDMNGKRVAIYNAIVIVEEN